MIGGSRAKNAPRFRLRQALLRRLSLQKISRKDAKAQREDADGFLKRLKGSHVIRSGVKAAKAS
jgi:hypothetical protein